MIILGIDPGTNTTGYGLIDTDVEKVIDYGCIRPPATLSTSQRYLIIFEGVRHLVATHRPHACSIETQFIYKNPKSALTLGMARGAAMIACAEQNIEVFEYNPSQVKAAVTGSGRASKEQMAYMVQRLGRLQHPPTPLDASDALALCYCHFHRSKSCMTISVER